ncbi:MAG: asparagine--tRNA ligase [Bacteroidia bacterium]
MRKHPASLSRAALPSMAEIYRDPPLGETLSVSGWIRTRRSSKKVSFLELTDGSTLRALQVVLNHEQIPIQEIEKLHTGAAIKITGTLVETPDRPQPFEMQAHALEIYGLADPEKYPLQKKAHSLEFLRQVPHLRVRTQTFGALFRIRSQIAYAVHQFFQERGFFYVHTPILTGSDCEGAGQLFQVTTLPLAHPPKTSEGKIDYTQDFFGRPAYLTVSGQLEAEILMMGLGKVYTFGPTFRAEPSHTPRHLAEFWMIEPEMAFYDLEQTMNLAEEFLKHLIRHALNHLYEDLAFLTEKYTPSLLGELEQIKESAFIRLTYTEAIELLQKSQQPFEYPPQWGMDLQTEHERYLVEKHFQKPVIVYDYPKDIKAFYMKQNPDGKTVRAMDVLFPRVGEIIGGSQREDDLDKLEQRMKELGIMPEAYEGYLDSRRYGTVPHSGFGLGFERFLGFLTGMGNLRDVIPFFRAPKHLFP